MLNYLVENYQAIYDGIVGVLTAIGAVVTAASTLVALTPTQKDDAVLAKIMKIIDRVSVFNAKIEPVIKKKK